MIYAIEYSKEVDKILKKWKKSNQPLDRAVAKGVRR